MENEEEEENAVCSLGNRLQSPRYCDSYKFLLVEELVLEKNFAELHVGKCCVIGKLRQNNEGDFDLENITLEHLPRLYRLPEGTITIRLLDSELRTKNVVDELRNGHYSEVCGEIVLLNMKTTNAENAILTPIDLHARLRRISSEAARTAYLAELQETHKPGIRLHFAKRIDRANQLAELNLAIRLFTK